jgi:uncharacterized protein (DUF427 family)
MALRFADHEFAALGELRWHPEAKRVRAFVDGAIAVDSTRARIVWEPRRVVPSFAVPVSDIEGALVPIEQDAVEEHPVSLGDGPLVLDPSSGFTAHSVDGTSFDIIAGTRSLRAAAFAPADADLDGYVIVDFDAFDEWREEDEVLVGHARDPFKTVDTRRSSRHVEVEIDGTVIADSTRSVMLFETYLPTRYYLPREDVRMELLVPTDKVTVCAYKGQARYWSARVNDSVVADVAWSYEDPHNYATLVKDAICFFDELVDVRIDGGRQARPRTPWSN